MQSLRPQMVNHNALLQRPTQAANRPAADDRSCALIRHCERCGLVQLRPGVVDKLNERIERSRTLHGDLREELEDLRERMEDELAQRRRKYEEARLRESW